VARISTVGDLAVYVKALVGIERGVELVSFAQVATACRPCLVEFEVAALLQLRMAQAGVPTGVPRRNRCARPPPRIGVAEDGMIG
jgi:hypothetical protein